MMHPPWWCLGDQAETRGGTNAQYSRSISCAIRRTTGKNDILRRKEVCRMKSFGSRAQGARLERMRASPRWVRGGFRNLPWPLD
jgi:hypothetical protein